MAVNDKTEETVNVQSAPRTIAEQPGGLRNDTRMTIQTRQAQKIVVGRKAGKGVEQIVGLLMFGRRMKLLWLSAQANDPYADWYLLRIEDSMAEARHLIREKKQWLDQVLQSLEGFNVGVAQSLEPVQVSIVFQNPYGYMGAYLVADYDALCCSVFTASHIGLIDRKQAHGIIEAAGKSIRRTFDQAMRWKFTGVTRDDMAANNKAAERAKAAFGDCPEPVLAGTKRAKMAPEIHVPKATTAEVKTKSGSTKTIEVKTKASRRKVLLQGLDDGEDAEAEPDKEDKGWFDDLDDLDAAAG